MVATYPLIALFVTFSLSLVIVRVGSVALRMTGLSPDVASFQAASAFSGAGYTTEEAEQAVSLSSRRAVIKALIRLGSVGLVGVLVSIILSFTRSQGQDLLTLLAVLGGVGGVILVARSQWFNRLATPPIEWALSRTTELDVRDYTRLLGLQREYRVAEVEVDTHDWLADATPEDLRLADEGVVLLGLYRNGSYIGAPGAETTIRSGDTVLLYGRADRLKELAGRDAGDTKAHEDAVEEHDDVLAEQERRIE